MSIFNLYNSSMSLARIFTPTAHFLSQLQLRNVTFCILLPLLGAYWSIRQPLHWQTVALGIYFYISTGIGITAGKAALSKYT